MEIELLHIGLTERISSKMMTNGSFVNPFWAWLLCYGISKPLRHKEHEDFTKYKSLTTIFVNPLGLRDYAAEFLNHFKHEDFIKYKSLTTIFVNPLSLRDYAAEFLNHFKHEDFIKYKSLQLSS